MEGSGRSCLFGALFVPSSETLQILGSCFECRCRPLRHRLPETPPVPRSCLLGFPAGQNDVRHAGVACAARNAAMGDCCCLLRSTADCEQFRAHGSASGPLFQHRLGFVLFAKSLCKTGHSVFKCRQRLRIFRAITADSMAGLFLKRGTAYRVSLFSIKPAPVARGRGAIFGSSSSSFRSTSATRDSPRS